MNYKFSNSGTCSSAVEFEIDDGKIHGVRFTGGCNGNLKAIGKLVEGEDSRSVAKKLRGNTCGFRSTSCADQLAIAIEKALDKK